MNLTTTHSSNAEMNLSGVNIYLKNLSSYGTDLKKTGSRICRSKMKPLAAILVGPIPYIEIPLRTAFFFGDYCKVMNDQHMAELSFRYC